MTASPHRRGWFALCGVVVAACGHGPDEQLSTAAQRSIFGQDDREDVYEHPDGTLRERAEKSVVALLKPRLPKWELCAGAMTPVHAETLQEHFNVCPDQRFVDQPLASDCSGTLIDDDLVLTAAHCVDEDYPERSCSGMHFVFGYGMFAGEGVKPIPLDNVYSCRRRAFQDENLDAVVIQLDRPVGPPYEPAPVAPAAPAAGDAMAFIGFPSGLPMKIAAGCEVKAISGSDLKTNCDGFNGNSGSGTFDSLGQVAGVYNVGTGDYVPTGPGGCSVPSVKTDEGVPPDSGVTVPQWSGSSDVQAVLADLCGAQWPSKRLCNIAPSCGDGVCSPPSEDAANCATDCPPATCGDGVCDADERTSCSTDCGEFLQCDALDGGVAGAAGAGGTAGAAGAGGAAASTPDASEPESGCSCRSGASGHTSTSWLLLLLCAGLLRRSGVPITRRGS